MIDQIEKLANLKGIAVLLFLIFLGVFVVRNWDFVTDVTFHITNPGGQVDGPTAGPEGEPVESTATIHARIANVEVCELDFELPCYFLAEIENSGKFEPTDIEVVVDFGRAGLREFEIRPDFSTVLEADTWGGVLRVKRRQLEPRQSLYIYALTTQPGFGTISVYTDGKLRQQLTYQQYRSRGPESIVPEKFIGFLWIVGAIIVTVFAGWGVIVMLTLLNRLVGIDWE